MLYLVISFFSSFLLCFLIFKLKLAHDTHQGPQKFHITPTPRIGGLAVYVSLVVAGLSFVTAGKSFADQFMLFVFSAFPVFIGGFVEDITGNVSPKWRLLGGVLSGIALYLFLDASVYRIDVPVFDSLLNLPVVSVAFTAFAVAGVSHAFNIIDGFNGLASGVAMLVFGAYAYVSFLQNDFFLLYISLVSLAATLGFFLWNYPFGYVFLGDGGAYLLGFIAASTGVLMVNRHPEVSPWFPFLLVLYPVWETVFSIYRRKFLKRRPAHMPDALHFHQLFYKRIIRYILHEGSNILERNYFTTPFIWIMELVCFVPAVIFWKDTYLLMFFSLCFVVFYTWLYFRIVKFKTPKILVIRVKLSSHGRDREKA